MRPPTSKKEIQSLIGRLVWIRKFLETRLDKQIRSDTFSNLMRPIHELNKTNKTFTWTEKEDKTFEKIKNRLSSPPVISFPDSSQFFTLTTDASDVACGAIQMQEADNGKEKDYSSRLKLIQPHRTELVYHRTGSIREKIGDPEI